MGIRGLARWLNHEKQSDLHKPRVLRISEKKRPSQRTIVVDALTLLFRIPTSDWTTQDKMFSNTKKMIRVVCELVESFRAVGVELVFFFDSWYKPNKMNSKKGRMAQQMRSHDDLRAQFTAHPEVRDTCHSCVRKLINLSFFWLLEFESSLRQAGCQTFFTKCDADIAIVKYIRSHAKSVIALCSKDTDFFAFNLPPDVGIMMGFHGYKFEEKQVSITYIRPRDVWHRLGLSGPSKWALIALTGNDFVRGSLRFEEALQAVQCGSHRVSSCTIKKIDDWYQMTKTGASSWEEDVGGRTALESFVQEITTEERAQFQCEIGVARFDQQLMLLVRPVRQHFYFVRGIASVEEVMFLPQANGVTEEIIGLESEVITSILNETFPDAGDEKETENDLDGIVTASCRILEEFCPFEGHARFYRDVLHEQYQRRTPDDTLRIHGFMKRHVPRLQDLTIAYMFKQIVFLVHGIMGRLEMENISTWLDEPLFHYLIQCEREDGLANAVRWTTCEKCEGKSKRFRKESTFCTRRGRNWNDCDEHSDDRWSWRNSNRPGRRRQIESSWRRKAEEATGCGQT